MATELFDVAQEPSFPVPVAEIPTLPSHEETYVFAGLGRSAVTHNHGIHKYPAKFVPQIPRWALRYEAIDAGATVLDPFAGSGTTVLEAALHGYRGIGVDINPLSRLITRAKTAVLPEDFAPQAAAQNVVADAQTRASAIATALVPKQSSLGLHFTWANWFASEQMAALLSIRDAITSQFGSDSDVSAFLLVCLSSVAKACSLLDENQIKVRLVATKNVADPYDAFVKQVSKAGDAQLEVRRQLSSSPRAEALHESATALPLDDDSVDRVVTSPPYINAVDYTMAHKYNIFLLGLLAPDSFKDHCRQYVGMTERAVRARDLDVAPRVENDDAHAEVRALWDIGTKTSRNRSYVTAQYFREMTRSYKEMRRVLKPGSLAITVIGVENRVCGRAIPTAEICERIAVEAGFSVKLRFFHEVANVSSMRLSRNATGGKVSTEQISVLVNE